MGTLTCNTCSKFRYSARCSALLVRSGESWSVAIGLKLVLAASSYYHVVLCLLLQDGDYEAVIGIETHVQLNTKTKAFCNCNSEFGAEPNANVCPVCLGHPVSA